VRGQLRSEVLKLRTVWSTWLLMAIAVVVMLLLALLVAFVHPHRGTFTDALTPLPGSAGGSTTSSPPWGWPKD
jgi:hypothetical protein